MIAQYTGDSHWDQDQIRSEFGTDFFFEKSETLLAHFLVKANDLRSDCRSLINGCHQDSNHKKSDRDLIMVADFGDHLVHW